MSWSFDSDVLIYASSREHELAEPLQRFFDQREGAFVGSVLLLPEVLIKPVRLQDERQAADARSVLARLRLVEVTERIAQLAIHLGSKHGLKSVDAVHLATAVAVGADYFVTNNSRDFRPTQIREVNVISPRDLALS